MSRINGGELKKIPMKVPAKDKPFCVTHDKYNGYVQEFLSTMMVRNKVRDRILLGCCSSMTMTKKIIAFRTYIKIC